MGKRGCSVEGCGNEHIAKGFCNMHYKRLARIGATGEAERRKAQDGEPLAFALRSLSHTDDSCLIWPFANGRGYGHFYIDGQMVKATRFVCEKKNGPPPDDKSQACHSCGNGHAGCISPSHLYWGTPTENSADMEVHGTRVRGELHPFAVITEDQVRTIRSMRQTHTCAEIAALYGISRTQAFRISRGKSWAWLDP